MSARNDNIAAPPIYPTPRRMTVPSLPTYTPTPTLASPFNTPTKSELTINSSTNGRISNAADLVLAITSDPNRAFTCIHDLGAEDIRLKAEVKQLKEELERTKEENLAHHQSMMATFEQIMAVQASKMSLLHECIARLQEEICRLNGGGGAVVQGVWITDGVALGQDYGESPWDALIAETFAGKADEGSNGTGSEESEIGNKPRLDPNAVCVRWYLRWG
jgi:hypothetical protein